jgi:hypothetical protein
VEIGTPRKTIWVIPSNQLIMLESNAGGTENNDEGKEGQICKTVGNTQDS